MPGRDRTGRDRTWWTKARVVEALRRFYVQVGHAPTSTEGYQALATGTGTNPHGRGNPYPSSYAVLRWFRTFREAWTAAGVDVDRSWEEWTVEEDRFVTEGAGVLSRRELAEALDRSPDAVHRRLYDLGVHTYQARGWSLSRVERVTQVPGHLLRKYLDRGDLPYYRGSKCVYVDPGDLPVVEEIDWSDPPPELEQAARRSLQERLVKQLAGQDWQRGRLYRPHKLNQTDRRWRRLVRPPPKPIGLEAGDWVRVRQAPPSRPDVLGRVGLIHLVHWNANSDPRWMARVEFKKERRHGNDRPRVTYSIPLDCLEWLGPLFAAPTGEGE